MFLASVPQRLEFDEAACKPEMAKMSEFVDQGDGKGEPRSIVFSLACLRVTLASKETRVPSIQRNTRMLAAITLVFTPV